MNTYRFRQLLASVFSSIVVISVLIFSLAAISPNAQAETPSSPVIESVSNLGSLIQLGYAPAIASPPSFTVYLPSVMRMSSVPPANPCSPGQTITDPANDVSPAYIDVIALSTSLNQETLQAIFGIRDVPSQLTFDRIGVPQYALEYGWIVYVDVDNNPQTGYTGNEYSLSAMHWPFQPDSPTTKPIADGVQVDTRQYDSTSNRWKYFATATLSVDPQADKMTLTGNVPGINSASRLSFSTVDYNPGGTSQGDTSSCSIK